MSAGESAIIRAACWQQSTVPVRFRASVRSHSSSLSSRNGTIVPLPALATKMFSSGHLGPDRLEDVGDGRRDPPCRRPAGPRTALALAPDRSSSHASFSVSTPRAIITTLAPASTNRAAMPRPIPLLAPVIAAHCPASGRSWMSVLMTEP